MKEFKGTPGQWRMESDEWSDYIISDSTNPTKHGVVICGMDSQNENFEHDARLIAAAPELLKAMQDTAEILGKLTDANMKKYYSKVAIQYNKNLEVIKNALGEQLKRYEAEIPKAAKVRKKENGSDTEQVSLFIERPQPKE